MAMTTCRECSVPVAGKAPTCPACGVVEPGQGHEQRDAEMRAAKAKGQRLATLGCGGFLGAILLLVGGGALWNELTDVDLDQSAEDACSAVTTARFGSGAVQQGVGRVQAVSFGMESTSDGLAEAAGPRPLDPETVTSRYLAVAAWCDENAE